MEYHRPVAGMREQQGARQGRGAGPASARLGAGARREDSRGCLRAALAVPALALLAPFAAAVRALGRWRRGPAARSRLDRSRAAGRVRLDLVVDVPTADELDLRLRATDSLVRLAEALRRSDDVYHLVVRPLDEEEPRLRPIGPLIQELGEQLALQLGRTAVRGRTLLWLTLARGRPLVAAADPGTADPDGPGEPDGLVAAADPRWAVATAIVGRGPSVVLRIAVWVGKDDAAAAEGALRRLAG